MNWGSEKLHTAGTAGLDWELRLEDLHLFDISSERSLCHAAEGKGEEGVNSGQVP